jgi:tricorn protease-like protein
MIIFKKDNGWSKAKNIGELVNTYTYDFSPKVSPDGSYLYFASRINRDFNLTGDRGAYTYKKYQNYLRSPLNGFGNIYRIKISELNLQ